MKIWIKIFFTITLIAISQKSYSQTITKLDEKNGFKNFKFGDDISKWNKKELIFINSDKKGGLDIYEYNGNCCEYVFTHKVNKTLLGFSSEKKLAYISFRTDKSEPRVVDHSYDGGFIKLFGKPQIYNDKKIITDIENPTITEIWTGKKVILYLTTYWGVDTYAIIVLADNAFRKKQLNSGF